MSKGAFIISFLLIFFSSQCQDILYARKIVDTLTSKYYWGRGYTNHGMEKAAEFLVAQFNSYKLQPFNNKGFLQSFGYPVNTFPGKMEVSVNGKSLRPGIDFIVSPDSKAIKGKAMLEQQDSTHFSNQEKKISVSLEKKLTWSVSGKSENRTNIYINKKYFLERPSSILVNIENKFNKNFVASNVCGYVKGTEQPDSLLVITAHYDHLGGMGSNTYFPGANDNASGIALLLSLAQHYANHPAKYSIAFICFAGEEAGLIGSKYFSEQPLFPLDRIRFLLNIDLAGTGEEGITIVNGPVFNNEFALLNEVNKRENYFVKIKSRGKAANSDHYWFTEMGVPSFFIYTLGGIQAYHDVDDRASTLPMTEFEDLFRMVVEFNRRLMN
jgi:aminopeptidase YwaD